jgi:hypothetical protein
MIESPFEYALSAEELQKLGRLSLTWSHTEQLVGREASVDHISNLRLSDVRVFPTWTAAPLGAILQMKAGNAIVVGMRTQYVASNKTSNALVVLGGVGAGNLITDDCLGDGAVSEAGPALEVGSQVEIIAIDPAPFNCRAGLPLAPGALLRLSDREGTFFVWTSVNETDITAGGLCVASDQEGYNVGKCSQFKNRALLVGISQKIDLRLTEPKLVHVQQ